MNKEKFWSIISLVNSDVDCNDKTSVLRATKEKLCQLPSREIVQWFKIYDSLHTKAYREDLWQACSRCGIHSSDDGFHYFRAWLISRGQEMYTAVLANPDSLSVSDPQNADFESYGYVAYGAYAERACQEQLGEEGFKDLKSQWVSDNKESVERFCKRSHLSFDQSCERLFSYALQNKYDIFDALSEAPKNSLDEKIESAHFRSKTCVEDAAPIKAPVSER